MEVTTSEISIFEGNIVLNIATINYGEIIPGLGILYDVSGNELLIGNN